RRKLVYYNMNKAEQLAYDEHINAIMIQNDVLSTAAMEGRQEGLAEGRQEGLAEGRQEGLAEGRMEEKQANARRMKALNLPVETICQVTGLSAGEIENL
ncbi:hypothetical protein ACIXGS_09870, partial [Bacteroides fragilis]|nr:hypothetical protein [Bacteroides fragilis]MCY6315920.1 hypothetical protein [Bacteroides fragilis]